MRGIDESGEEAIARTAELSGLTPHEVRTVVRYYASYREEIDEWLQLHDADLAELGPGRHELAAIDTAESPVALHVPPAAARRSSRARIRLLQALAILVPRSARGAAEA